MKTTTYTKRDDLIALAFLPVYYVLFNTMLFGWAYFQHLPTFIYATISIIALWTPIYFLHALPAIYLREVFPGNKQVWIRMPLSILTHMIMSSLTVLGLFYGYEWVGFPGYVFDESRMKLCLVFMWVLNVLINMVHDYVYTFERWNRTLIEAEQLRHVSTRAQLESLKQQVNPHFLFNSLNSLISLIDEDPKQASTYTEELSSVYRYVLRANEQDLTDLDQELAFINSYYLLLKTRFSKGLNLVCAIDQQYGQYQIPPLTLQLLVENAVKHNIILPEQPLRIEIATDGQGQLHVRNNMQKKPTRVMSNGVGLSNIIAKYRVLGQPIPTVQEKEGQFVVSLPLIAQPVN